MRCSMLLALCLLAFVSLPAQEPAQAQRPTTVEPMDETPVFRVDVIQRTTRAVNYRHRGGDTRVDFRGTNLMPQAEGKAEVEGKAGRLEIRARFDKVKPPRTFGPEYLAYVLWAITPEGRPVNLGEVVLGDGDDASTRVTTELQAFGMIVTAEPYFAVTRPSNMVVIENVVRQDTKGFEQPIEAKFDLLERGEYTIDVPAAQLPATAAEPKTQLDLLQARNAVAIARASGADKYAPDSLAKAEDMLARAEDYHRRKQGRTPIGTAARGAVQAAEDARILTIRRREEERIAAERRAAQERTEQARQEAEFAQEQAKRAELEAELEAQRRAEAQQTAEEAERAKAEAEAAAERARVEREQAEAARLAALQQQQQLRAEAERARLAAQQAEQARLAAEREREEARARLREQLNQVLETRESARGLIVNMSDVLFDTGKATLRPGARERLSRIAGILLAYPDLKLEVEGHTDSRGTGDYNISLSQRRAAAVSSYLISQGVSPRNIVARGFGENQPIATNATPSGRQANRRVEVVVSGEAIETARSVAPAGGTGTTGGVTGAAAGTGTVQSTTPPAGVVAAPTQPRRTTTPGQPTPPAQQQNQNPTIPK